MTKQKLAVIGIVGVPATYGGFETLVDNLLDLLPQFYEVTVFCEAKSYKTKQETYKGAHLRFVNLNANGIQSIPYDIISILQSYKENDYLLILGVSGAIILPFIKPFYKGRIITNIDGLEWKRDKWNFVAKKYLKFSEGLAVKYSDVVIADNQHIQEYVWEQYQIRSTLIAYGGDHVIAVEKAEYSSKYAFIDQPYLFTVCRIEPENNILMLIEAFVESKCIIPYVIIGNWQASKYGKEIFEKYKDVENLHLLNPIYEKRELNALRSNCFYYLHGHSAGGTNPSLVEAMYLGLPIVAFDVAYNKTTTFNKATFFKNKGELIHLLSYLSSQDWHVIEALRDKQANEISQVAKENYKWNIINHRYKDLIELN